MRAGEFPDGAKVLRAKIDMASPNINMRDPIIYRILRMEHYRTNNDWCIYPMYDFAHPIEDMMENVTHSICTLEFEDHRPLYDWVVENCNLPAHPRQIEFARLNMTRTIMSKRYLKKLVQENSVSGWDDPRMPTLAGLRRRGFTPAAIRDFCDRIGVAKSNSIVEAGLLEHCVREDLAAKTAHGFPWRSAPGVAPTAGICCGWTITVRKPVPCVPLQSTPIFRTRHCRCSWNFPVRKTAARNWNSRFVRIFRILKKRCTPTTMTVRNTATPPGLMWTALWITSFCPTYMEELRIHDHGHNHTPQRV